MTVVEIKEKINTAIENSAGERKTTAVRYLLSVLHNIKSMLDELEERPKAHWEDDFEGKDNVFTNRCSHCYQTNNWRSDYCPNCGAEMEVEDE